MAYFSYSIFITLVVLMDESSTVDAENKSKYVCSGDFIQLFRNIAINSTDMIVELHINASKKRRIAMWALEDAKITDGYSSKVLRDKYGDIWIRNVSLSDEAQYILQVGSGSSFVTYTVDLFVHTAPTLNCKPKIKRIENVLVASLEAKECGNPSVYVDWLNYLGIHSEGKDSIMLPRENPAGTYYACIGGPALMCARTSKLSDYCTAFLIEGEHGSQESSTISKLECTASTFNLAMLIAIIGIFVVLFVYLLAFFLWKCRNTCVGYNTETPTKEKSFIP
ncbi:hypothetical protein ACJMK2_027004 [Sinanodonta woodiana]|uniref:Uncharacterized protein n=1 Tax=Sinanodonta woodiana TaxID=1069815 RepID=A0ABD3XPW1_SINWO